MNIPDFSGKGTPNCKNHEDPDIFMVEPFEKDAGKISAKAKKVCTDGTPCPYIAECFSYAVHNKEPGVWGGTSENERRKLLKKGVIPLEFRVKSLHYS